MREVLATFGGSWSIYTHSLWVVVAFFWYGFVIYKKGSEYRYDGESLLDLAVLSGTFGWMFARLGYALTHLDVFRANWLRLILLSEHPGYSYLGLVVGLVAAVVLLAKRGELKFFDGLDLLGLALPAAVCFERLGLVLSGGGTGLFFGLPIEIFQALLFLLIFVWLWRLEKEYRTFGWYRFRRTQARSGFIFGASFFLSGAVIVLSGLWLWSVERVTIGSGSLIMGAVVIYLRSGRSLAHDVKLLPVISFWYTRSKWQHQRGSRSSLVSR